MTNPIVSIVSGTFNRIDHLKSMVESARLSIGIGLDYEIVLVDGGSTDGTQAWCKTQPDIVLIEQGILTGACRAFNVGCEVAMGHYIILGNDDISFVDESIRSAIAFMDDNPRCGVGCFYQDREGQPWHVSLMSAIKGNKQTAIYYGQVCIVPKWLGDKVGWWGDYYTYAGDNELSCNIAELGYEILPVPCAAIHDVTVADELRVINSTINGSNSEKGHADSLKWVAKWKKPNGLLGPVIPFNTNPIRSDMSDMERMTYAPIYEAGFPGQKLSKRGLKNALKQHFLVDEVDYVPEPLYLLDEANAWNPHIILTQFHGSSGEVNSQFVRDLRREHKKALLCNWNGDYFPENFLSNDYIEMMRYYDLAMFVTDDVKEVYDKAEIVWKYWQIGFESPINPQKSPEVTKRSRPGHSVIFLGNGHYPFRLELGKVLRSFKKIDVGLYGSWPTTFKANGSNLYDYDAGYNLYASSKITISDSRPQASGFVSNRVYQAMAAGCFVLQQWFRNMTELTGFVDGEHLIVYNNTEELYDLIPYWLSPEHELERKKIAKVGHDYCVKYCSFDARVRELLVWLADLRT